jgi:hypothetical protein
MEKNACFDNLVIQQRPEHNKILFTKNETKLFGCENCFFLIS